MNILPLIKRNKEKIFFLSILFLGSFLRLYRLPDTMQFLGDQGRDALIARGILIDHDPAFIGPVTSVGNMYLGPFYYYFMVLPLLLTYPSPIGPAYAVAFVGILTLAFIYILGRDMVGKRAAMIAMLLYALSPVVITGVRFSWNPNIVPFFSLIALWAVWKTTQKQPKYWILVGICAALLFQLHYIALILIGCLGLIWIIQFGMQLRIRNFQPHFIQSTLWAIGIFALSLLPLLIFDTKHDWLNTRAFAQFFFPTTGGESHFRSFSDPTGVAVSLLSMAARVIGEYFGIIAHTLGQKIVIVLGMSYFLIKAYLHTEPRRVQSARMLLLWMAGISVLFLALYKASVFDHYLGFTFPIIFLLLGYVGASVWRSIFLRPLLIGAIIVCSIMSIVHYPGTQQLGSTVALFDRSSQEIAKHIPEGVSYNFLSYSPTRDLQAMNYRYFVTAYGKPPAAPDDWTSFKRLYIIDEEHRESPFDEAQYVIKIWPNRRIIDQFTIVDGPSVYVLER